MAPPRTRKDSGPTGTDDRAPDDVQAVDSILDDAPETALPPPSPVVELLAEPDDTPPPPPRAEPAPPPQPPAPRRRGGALALFLGGVVAAGAGCGLSRVVPGGWPLQ
ncbi:hypothetical protein ACLD7X_019485, partial [Aphanothece microscopica RSMan92]